MSSLLASFTKRCPEQTQEAVQLAMFGTDLRCAMRCPGLTYGTALPEAWWDSSPSSQKSNSGALRSKPPRSKSHYPYRLYRKYGFLHSCFASNSLPSRIAKPSLLAS